MVKLLLPPSVATLVVSTVMVGFVELSPIVTFAWSVPPLESVCPDVLVAVMTTLFVVFTTLTVTVLLAPPPLRLFPPPLPGVVSANVTSAVAGGGEATVTVTL